MSQNQPDEKYISVVSGHGGQGCIAFHREKYVDRGGPDGGDGGRGGHVYLKSNPRYINLQHLHEGKTYKAAAGEPGGRNACSGADGRPVTIQLPPGTQVFDADSGELLHDFPVNAEESILFLKGGKGGLGNQHFATSVNQAPEYAQPGLPGERRNLRLSLKLIADVGLVGLPNAGKSTLLGALTGADPRTGDYPFTTLSPNIGVMQDDRWRQLTLADIPGIIEGASKGSGLGLSFLRHIERVKMLVFVMDVGSVYPEEEYSMLKKEMESYSPLILEKPRIIVLNKIDTVGDAGLLDELVASLNFDCPVFLVSALTGQNLDRLRSEILDSVSAGSSEAFTHDTGRAGVEQAVSDNSQTGGDDPADSAGADHTEDAAAAVKDDPAPENDPRYDF